jgi:hypothetical protein
MGRNSVHEISQSIRKTIVKLASLCYTVGVKLASFYKKGEPMPNNRRTIELSEAQWLALDALAKQLNAVPVRGPKPPKPSWRMLLRQIADGELTVAKPQGESHE